MKKYRQTNYLQNIYRVYQTSHTVQTMDKIVFSLCKLFT